MAASVDTSHDRSPRDPRDLPDRLGWALVAILTVAVLISWSPGLSGGLGDDHEGRILARHALHISNAQEDGLAASGWLSDWSPYRGGPEADQERYAHHPPLLNVGYYLAAEVLPVRLDVAVRIFAYLTGVATLPIGVALLRRVRVRWLPVLAATTAVAVTPLFWVYGRLNANITLLLAMVWCIVRVAEDREVHRGELAVAAVVSWAAVVAGYLGLATAALFGLWLLSRRRLDRVTVTIGAAMALGAAVTLIYVLGGSVSGEIGDQVQMRTQGGAFTAREFVVRIATWVRQLLPSWWWALLAPAAVVAGCADRRTRVLVALTGLVAIGYVVLLPNGSYIHDYWIYPVLLPVWFGAAVLVEHAERLRSWAAPLVLVVVLAAGAIGMDRGNVPSRYVTEPQRAGTLARATPPPATQEAAWRTAGLAAPRWLSFYWDLPPAAVGPGELAEVPDGDLVFVALGSLPATLGDRAAVEASAERVEGDYAVITADALRAIAAEG